MAGLEGEWGGGGVDIDIASDVLDRLGVLEQRLELKVKGRNSQKFSKVRDTVIL